MLHVRDLESGFGVGFRLIVGKLRKLGFRLSFVGAREVGFRVLGIRVQLFVGVGGWAMCLLSLSYFSKTCTPRARM